MGTKFVNVSDEAYDLLKDMSSTTGQPIPKIVDAMIASALKLFLIEKEVMNEILNGDKEK